MQLELVDGHHDKYYRILALPELSLVISQYGRRGATGQVKLQLDAKPAGYYMDHLVEAKRAKGYRQVSPRLTFDYNAPTTPPLLNSRHIQESDLADRFADAWTAHYGSVFKAIVDDPAPLSVAIFATRPLDVRAWPWLARFYEAIADLPHLATADGQLYTLVPTRAWAAFDFSYGPSFNVAGPALPTDDLHTLEILKGIWTPNNLELDTSSPVVALTTARLLDPALVTG
jgi:predicted DNA-binding WGR domain protein